ncbi:hypothetical protein AB0K71_11635 [Streptomyces syringium]|uniref:hypothetical protein n=1 Tax=Streptomyces syringium TaxID=76729 RepID=UPI0033D5362F
MDPILSRPAYRDEETGCVRIPVWLSKNGRHVAETEMVLPPSEAALLRDRLTDAGAGTHSALHSLCAGHSGVMLAPGVVLVPKDGQRLL